MVKNLSDEDRSIDILIWDKQNSTILITPLRNEIVSSMKIKEKERKKKK